MKAFSAKVSVALAAMALPLAAKADSVATVEGSSLKVIEVKPEASTGLNNIFVVFDSRGCTLRFAASNGYTARLYRYSNLGGGYAEEITDADRDARSVAVALADRDMGYILEDGSSRYYCWVTDYALHLMSLRSVVPSDLPDCSYSVLDIDGSAEPITYYTINGQQRTLSREIYVDYVTQEFDARAEDFADTPVRKVYESLGTVISISPPAYTSTYFEVSGDRFLREWGKEISYQTGLVEPTAVECSTKAHQDEYEGEEGSNVMKGDSNGLGGSAPADITFYAYVTEGVLHYEWEMSRSQDFENPEYRFYQKDLDYTFTEEGKYYLRFIGSNADGSCEAFSEVYEVSIGASALECPNAFSPNGDGVNDVWKVSYRSLIEFHCEIFNRNGQKIYGFDDPSDGWDGTWHGKTVRSGVYYYVVTAVGADGEKYKKSGDINIINSVRYGTSAPSESPLEE